MNMNKQLDILCYNIRFLKVKYKLTQQQLAEIGKVDKRKVSSFLKRQYPEKMNLEFIINVAEYFGLEVNKLFLLNFGE